MPTSARWEIANSPRVYLKTPNAPGQRAFLRCAASFFLEIRQYSCEKMSCATQKSLAAGHIMSFQIHPKIPAETVRSPGRCGHRPLRLTAKSLRIRIGLSLFAITCCDLSGAPAPVHRGQVHITLTPSPSLRPVRRRRLPRTKAGAFRPSADTRLPVRRAGALRALTRPCSCGTGRRRS